MVCSSRLVACVSIVLASCSPRTPTVDVGSTGSSAVPSDAAAHGAPGDGRIDPVAMTAEKSDVIARFERPAHAMRAGEAKLAVTIENRGTSVLTLPTSTLASAIFALEVYDADGNRKYTIPPGVPPLNYQPRTDPLGPGQSVRFEFDLNVFSPELSNGSYTARLSALPLIESAVVTFTIRS